MRTVTIDIPQPGPWLAINDRSAWQVRWQRTRTWRRAAEVWCRQAKHEPIAGPVRAVAVIHKTTRVQYDLDGVTASIKACIDGCRDAGLIDGDDTSRVVELVVRPGVVCKPGRVVLTFEEVAP